MSPKTDTTIRRRHGSQQRAAAQVGRRRYSAARGFQYRRQLSPPIFGTPILGSSFVITVVRTLTPSTSKSTATSRPSTTLTTRSSSKTTSFSSSSSYSSSSSSSSPETISQLPPFTSTPSASTGSPTQGPAGANSTNGSQNEGLSSGAIAGIAITVVVVLAALIAFLVRRRLMANRAEKRSEWLDKSGFSVPLPSVMVQSDKLQSFPPPVPPAPEPYDYASPRLSYSYPVPPPPPPSIPFADSSRPASLTPGRRGSDFSPAPSIVPFQSSAVPMPVPVVPPSVPASVDPPEELSDNAMTVQCTFIPSMTDELSITTGETVRVLQEYDDGWALCANSRGEQGMVPMECLGVSPADRPGLTRSSSLSGKS